MARSYTRTAGETPAARLLISLSAGLLANHKVHFGPTSSATQRTRSTEVLMKSNVELLLSFHDRMRKQVQSTGLRRCVKVVTLASTGAERLTL